MARAVVAVVDDDESFREALSDLLGFAGLGAAPFASAEAVLASADLGRYDAFVLDVQMPRLSGLDLIGELRGRGLATPVIFITSHAAEGAMSRQALAAGAMAVLGKPFEPDHLIELLDRALA